MDSRSPTVKDFTQLFNKVAEATEHTKKHMKVEHDKKCRPAPNYTVGQQVWLSMENLHIHGWPLLKLTKKWLGPYKVFRVLPNAVELKL